MRIVNLLDLFLNIPISINLASVYSPSVIIWLSIIGMFMFLIVVISSKSKEVEPTIESTEVLDDGSYCIVWGYVNKHGTDIRVNKGESCLLVSNGAALIVGNQPPHEFQKGRQKEALRVIALENTVVEWLIRDKKKKFIASEANIKKGK
jgi:hypothetical protein